MHNYFAAVFNEDTLQISMLQIKIYVQFNKRFVDPRCKQGNWREPWKSASVFSPYKTI